MAGRDPLVLAAWEALLRAHRHLADVLDAELRGQAGLGLEEYDVLYQLATAEDGRRRMTDLAGRLLVSRSSCTRLVERLVGRGLVQRESPGDDRRVVVVGLTAAGRRTQRRAAAVHLRGIEAHVGQRLSSAERSTVAAALERLASPDPAAGRSL